MLNHMGNNPYLTQTDKDFFLLLRAGLWQKVEESLSANPDWSYIYRLACEQAIQGIIADGIGTYKSVYPDSNLDAQIYNDCLNQSAQIVRQNYQVNQIQSKVCQLLESEKGSSSSMQQSCGSTSEAFEPLDPAKPLNRPPDIEPSEAFDPAKPLNQASALEPITYVILKGQGVAQSYPKPMLRCSGDIDLFFTQENYQRAKDLLKPLSTSIEDKPLSLECALVIEGVDIELHGHMTSGINKAADKHLQIILNKVLIEGDTRTLNILGKEVTLPSANFDAIYILTHTIRHLGSFGISLRQVIDWTMHMHANRDAIDRNRLQSDIQQMHLQNLWTLFSTFAVEYLGAPREDFLLGSSSSNGSSCSMQQSCCSSSSSAPSEALEPLEPAKPLNHPLGIEPSEALDPAKRLNQAPAFEPHDSALNQAKRLSQLHSLWQIIAQSGSFGKNNPYFKHLHAGRLNERFFRIYYHTKQALVLRKFDTEFSNFLLKKELVDVMVSPFRYVFRR